MKLCLTIGVSKAPPLSYLPGAITVANEMGDWARNTGFVTEVITDENNIPVTIDRIKKILLKMLPINDEVELFILHFAGHGFRDGAEQNIWLPSDWHQELRAISVEALKSRLYRHGIKAYRFLAMRAGRYLQILKQQIFAVIRFFLEDLMRFLSLLLLVSMLLWMVSRRTC